MSSSSMPHPPSGDRSMSLFVSNDPADHNPRTSISSIVGICAAVLLLPCLAIGAYWAVITFVESGSF